jgi:hypothetical protein
MPIMGVWMDRLARCVVKGIIYSWDFANGYHWIWDKIILWVFLLYDIGTCTICSTEEQIEETNELLIK